MHGICGTSYFGLFKTSIACPCLILCTPVKPKSLQFLSLGQSLCTYHSSALLLSSTFHKVDSPSSLHNNKFISPSDHKSLNYSSCFDHCLIMFKEKEPKPDAWEVRREEWKELEYRRLVKNLSLVFQAWPELQLQRQLLELLTWPVS